MFSSYFKNVSRYVCSMSSACKCWTWARKAHAGPRMLLVPRVFGGAVCWCKRSSMNASRLAQASCHCGHCEQGHVRLSYNPYFSAYFFQPKQCFSLTTNQPEQCFSLFFQRNERGLNEKKRLSPYVVGDRRIGQDRSIVKFVTSLSPVIIFSTSLIQ